MRSLLVAIALVVIPASAFANVARRTRPGTAVAEPEGVAGVAIVHEDLAFDLRPLETGQPATIVATYRIANRGDTVTQSLVFVGGAAGEHGDAGVTLDGAPLHSQFLGRDEARALPWRTATTPALDGGEPLGYEVEDPLAFSFDATIPPGDHILAVHYGADPERDRSTSGGTIEWKLGYVLSPARTWDGFGDLAVTVALPADWEAAASPALAREGDTLRGRFTGLPADAIGLTVRAPTGALHDVDQWVSPILLALALVGVPFLLHALGKRTSSALAIVAGVLGWPATIAVTGYLFWFRDSFGIPDAQSAFSGYGHLFGGAIVAVGTIIAVPCGAWLVSSAQRQR